MSASELRVHERFARLAAKLVIHRAWLRSMGCAIEPISWLDVMRAVVLDSLE
jgi:hypothetical protein